MRAALEGIGFESGKITAVFQTVKKEGSLRIPVEHIVENCFRYCKGCFTMADVKVYGGNNRPCDLLAYNGRNGRTVSH